jgi:predicted nucleic acid-binding protein
MAYLDSSVVVSLFVRDVHAERVKRWLAADPPVWISQWTVAEFTSAMSHYVRSRRLTEGERDRAESEFDRWLARREAPLPVANEHYAEARALMRADVSLRAPDALHLAVAREHRMVMATLDGVLAAAAKRAGVTVADL